MLSVGYLTTVCHLKLNVFSNRTGTNISYTLMVLFDKWRIRYSSYKYNHNEHNPQNAKRNSITFYLFLSTETIRLSFFFKFWSWLKWILTWVDSRPYFSFTSNALLKKSKCLETINLVVSVSTRSCFWNDIYNFL